MPDHYDVPEGQYDDPLSNYKYIVTPQGIYAYSEEPTDEFPEGLSVVMLKKGGESMKAVVDQINSGRLQMVDPGTTESEPEVEMSNALFDEPEPSYEDARDKAVDKALAGDEDMADKSKDLTEQLKDMATVETVSVSLKDEPSPGDSVGDIMGRGFGRLRKGASKASRGFGDILMDIAGKFAPEATDTEKKLMDALRKGDQGEEKILLKDKDEEQ